MTTLTSPCWTIEADTRVLVLGYGNPVRRDDGLGPALAAEIEQLGRAEVTVEIKYQLTIEDAVAVAAHDLVFFLDATAVGARPFHFRRITPAAVVTFTSHCVEPEVVLAICQRYYQREPKAYHLLLRGYAFGLGEGLSAQARRNLASAHIFLAKALARIIHDQ